MRPGLLDPARQAEYPIILGKTLANRTIPAKHLMNVRYNWKSKQIPQRQVITENRASSNSYKLVVREGTSEPYKYNGTIDSKTTDPDSAYLALVFDKEKAAFVLESISESLNFNLTSATTKPNIDQLPQLETFKKSNKNPSRHEDSRELRDNDEDAADPKNPYDYRHFLAEATNDAEAGNSTPKAFTPGRASPIPTAPKLLTASKSATPLESTLTGPAKRRKMDQKAASHSTPRTSHPTANVLKEKSRTNPPAIKGRPVHKLTEHISLSEEEEEEEKVQGIHGKQNHSRDTSSSHTYAQSPHIIVDEASDLTIDMGSPPPKAKMKHRINPDAFASHSRPHSRANTASVSPKGKDIRDSDRDNEGDAEINDGDDDDDVEDLALPSPREARKVSNALSRITQDRATEDDDEDDGLAAELEAVFDQEDDGDTQTVGLGISASQDQPGLQHEEESEVSEEE